MCQTQRVSGSCVSINCPWRNFWGWMATRTTIYRISLEHSKTLKQNPTFDSNHPENLTNAFFQQVEDVQEFKLL